MLLQIGTTEVLAAASHPCARRCRRSVTEKTTRLKRNHENDYYYYHDYDYDTTTTTTRAVRRRRNVFYFHFHLHFYLCLSSSAAGASNREPPSDLQISSCKEHSSGPAGHYQLCRGYGATLHPSTMLLAIRGQVRSQTSACLLAAHERLCEERTQYPETSLDAHGGFDMKI